MPAAPPEPERAPLVPTNPDPIASLRIWGATWTGGGRDWEVPPLPASRWLEILMSERPNLEGWFPGFLAPEQELAFWTARSAEEITDEEHRTGAEEILEQVSGRRWWMTMRMCAS